MGILDDQNIMAGAFRRAPGEPRRVRPPMSVWVLIGLILVMFLLGTVGLLLV